MTVTIYKVDNGWYLMVQTAKTTHRRIYRENERMRMLARIDKMMDQEYGPEPPEMEDDRSHSG